MLEKFFREKKKLYLIIFIIATFGVLFSMIGTINNMWGVDFKYFFYFFTYQTNTLAAIFYFLIWLNFNYKFKGLNFIHNDKLKSALATYMGLILFTVFLLIGPLEILQNFNIGNGGLTDFPPYNDVADTTFLSIFGGIVKNVFIHFIVPVLILCDIYFSNNEEKEFDMTNVALFSFYPIIYLLNAFLIGSLTGLYPYSIFDITLYSTWIVMIFIFIEILFFICSYLLSLKRAKIKIS